jgi:hypothetical protein
MQVGRLTTALSASGTAVRVVHEARCPDIGPVCLTRAEPPQVHDQVFSVGELRALVDYAFHEHFSVELQLPFRVTNTTIQYRRLNGTLFTPDEPDLHHRNETLLGLGDPWLTAKTVWTLGPATLGGRLGLPVGRTEENPFALGRLGQRHQHVQFGSGTFDPIAGIDGKLPIGVFTLAMYGQAQLVLGQNAKGFRAGNRYATGLSGEGPLIGHLRGSLGVDVINEQPERWLGVVAQDGNLGRTDVLVGGALSYRFGSTTLSLSAKFPVYQHFITHGSHDPGQLTYPVIVNVTARQTFDLLGP